MINESIRHNSWCLQVYATPLTSAYTLDGTYARGLMQNAIPKTMKPIVPARPQGGFNWNSGLGRTAIGAGAGLAGGLLYKGISDDYNSNAGSIVNTVGNGVGDVLMAVNPVVGGIVKLGAAGIGAVINRLAGAKWNDKNIQNIESTIDLNRNVGNALASATTTGDLVNGYGMADTGLNFTKRDIGSEGPLSHRVGRRFNRLSNQYNTSNDYLSHGLAMGAKRVNDMQDDIAMGNTAAYGGLFDMLGNTGMGAVDYSFMNDYIASRQKKASDNNAFSGYIPIPNAFCGGGKMFPLGGDLQTHGADWSKGTKVIDAGGLHETNPNDGVQIGVDSQGTPNLVEEGEVVHNDYVYSNRIEIDDKTKEAFHIGKKRDMTYAQLAKKLGKEIEERPNDPISKKAYDAQMQELADNQERQKQEMEAQKAREAFEAMSPDEQMALISQMAAQQQQVPQSPEDEAMMQEQAAQEQMMAEQQMQGTPMQEGPLVQQAQMGIEGGVPQESHMQQPQMAAYGGPVNRYDGGGVLDFLRRLGYKTTAEAEKAGWKPSDFGVYADWSDITEDTALPVSFRNWNDFKKEYNDRITLPEQRAALKLGWTPTSQLIQTRWYEGDNGNAVNWTESAGKTALTLQELNDYARRYKNTIGWALDNGLIQLPQGNNTISMADVVAAMKQAPDYKATDEWLGSDIANMEDYLGRSKTLSKDAKGKYDSAFHNTWSKYGKFTQNGDGTWSYKLNDKADKEAFKKLFWDKRNDNMVGLMYNSRTLPRETSTNYLLNEDGSVTPILSNDLSGYEAVGNPLTWGDEANLTNRTAAFYRAKTAPAAPAATTSPADTPDDNLADYEPVKHYDKIRYAGVAGPIVAAGLQGLGFGRPDYSRLDAAVDAYNNGTRGIADYKPIGNYMRYVPMDIWSEQNRLNANARATDRAIANSGLTAGNRTAGLIAANYGNQVASSDLMKKAMEYNLGENKAVQDYNRGTDQFNASAYNQTSLSNAQMLNQDRQYRGSLAMQAAKERLDTDASWYNSLYGNISGAFRGLADIGRENREANWRNWLASNGYFDIPGEELERMGMVKRKNSNG